MSLFMMLRIYGWFSLRYSRRHPWRVAAVVLGLSLGAGVFVAVRLAVATSVRSFQQSMEAVTKNADFVVTRPGSRVPHEVLREILGRPFVKTASPVTSVTVRAHVEKSGAQKTAVVRLMGFDPILDRPLRPWAARGADSPEKVQQWSRLMSEPGTVFIGSAAARHLRLEPGSEITIHYQDRWKNLKVLGILEDEGLGLAEGGMILLADVSTVQEFLGDFGGVDRVEGAFTEGWEEEGFQELRKLLGDAYALHRPEERQKSTLSMVSAYEQNLSVLSFVSLFVGMFLVYSLTAFNSVSRRREAAVLRSLGASSGFVFLLLLLDGLLLGVVGWAVGIPTSLIFARDLLEAVSATVSALFARVEVRAVSVSLSDVIVSIVLTAGVSALAALQPARSLMAVPPTEAIRPRSSEMVPTRGPGRLTIVGGVLLGLVGLLSMAPSFGGVPVAGYASVFFLFCGFSLLTPGVLMRIATLPSRHVRFVGGEPCVLALKNLGKAGSRIAVSIGALITAVALFAALVIMISSFRKTVEAWVFQTVSGDLFLRPMLADLNGYRDPLPAEVVVEISGRADADVVAYRRIAMTYQGVDCALEGIDLDRLTKHGGFLFLKGRAEEAYQAMRSGDGVIISEVFSRRTGLRLGDRMPLVVHGVPMTLTVAGVYRDYRTQGAVIYMDLKIFQDRTGDRSWSGARIFFGESKEASAARAARLREEILMRFGDRYDLDVLVGGDLRRDILRVFDQTFAVTTVLLVLALMVAGLGMMTTLTVMTLERVVSLNTLKALGASTGQVRRMLLWEAAFMTAIGLVLGVACGFVLSVILIEVINAQSFGWTFVYHVPWGQLGVALPLIAAASLAATIPALRLAFLQSPAVLLREEGH